MKELTFLCIEDEEYFSDKLEFEVCKYMKEYGILVKFITYSFIPKELDYKSFDACFLDVEIGQESTITVMDEMRENNIDIPIVVFSNYDEYIYDSVKYSIFNFVRKSFFDTEIEYTLKKLEKYFSMLEEYTYINYNYQIYKIYLKDVLYVLTNSHHVIIYFVDGRELEIWKSYHEVFEKEFKSFIKVHRSYVINRDNCIYVDKKIVRMRNNKEIPLSKKGYKLLVKSLNDAIL